MAPNSRACRRIEPARLTRSPVPLPVAALLQSPCVAAMALWFLAITVGNLWVLIVNASVKNETVIAYIEGSGVGVMAFQMYFFAAFALLSAAAFGWYATRYRMVDHYRTSVAG